jgi:RNA polymerase sigma-70 factor (ECF subfamily)
MYIEDKIIFNEIKRGNKTVYKALFDDYYQSLVQFAQSYLYDQQESEDLVQELFLHIWENARKMTIQTSVKAYFYQSVKNRCLNRLKTVKVTDRNHLLYLEGMVSSEEDVQYFESDILEKIKMTINDLPPQMAQIFCLKFYDGLKREEIASQMNVSVNTVKTQLQRARAKLRELLLEKTNLLFLF